MNAAARALTQGTITSTIGLRALVFSRTMLCSTSLITTILLSALGLIFIKDQGRSLISDVARLQHMQEILQVRQGQLLLEEKTLSAQGRLESIAQNQLQMIVPQTHKIIVGMGK